MISWLEIWNWCQHEHKRYEFGPGLTAIIGPNGSGKSNLMGAVSWLWTGANPNPGIKEANIRTLSQQHERSKGQLGLINRGRTFEITRHLRPANEAATLTVNGDILQGARGETAVTNKLAELYGLDPKMVNRFMLVAQRDIFGFLAEQPEVRSKIFQQLFDTTHGTRCVKAIVDHDAKLKIPALGVDLDQLQAGMLTISTNLEQAEAALAAVSAVADFAAAQSRDQQVIDAYNNYTAASNEYNTLVADINAKQVLLQDDQSQLKLLADAAVGLELVVTRDREQTDAARAALANLQTYQGIVAQRQAWTNRLTELRGAAKPAPVVPDEPVKPTPPEQNPQIAEQQQRSRDMRLALQNDVAFVKQFRETGTAICPTCRTPAMSLEATVASVEQTIPGRTQELKDLDAQISAMMDEANKQQQAYAKAMTAYTGAVNTRGLIQQTYTNWQRAEASRTQEIAHIEQNLANQQSVAAPTGDAQVWTTTVTTYDECVTTLQTSRTAIATLTTKVATAQGNLDAQRQQAEQLLRKMANPVTLLEAQAAQERITARANSQQNYITLSTNVATLRAQQQSTGQQIAAALGQKQQIDAMRTWIMEGEQVQAALKQAQKIVLQRKLQQAETEMNSLLELCDLDYRIAADENLSFTATFADGRIQPAQRLSGGQQGILAMLFRIANAIQFAENLDVLFLDEPTAYLDKKSIAAFIPIFERLRSVLSDRGLQVIIITHEEDLAPLFDRVISL